MRFLLSSASKDLRRLRRDPVGLALWLGIPLFILALLWAVFGRGEVRPQGRLLVVDEDSSFGSALLLAAFREGPLAEMLVVEKLPRAEAEAKIRRGAASALLIIPRRFSRALLTGENTQLTLIKNPAQRILPAIIEETLSVLADGAFYVHALWGEQLRVLAEGPPSGTGEFSDVAFAHLSIRMKRVGERLGSWLDPLRIRLEVQVDRPASPVRRNFVSALGPGIVFLALLFTALGLSSDLWKERRYGTLRRLLATPQPVSWLLGGKLAAAAAVMFAVSLAGLAGVLWAAGTPARGLLAGAIWSSFAGSVLFLVFAWLQLYAGSERAASLLANMVGFPLALVGGSLFPFEAMPDWLARIGERTPNGWALVQLKHILEGTAVPARLGLAAAVLLAVAAAAFLLAARRLRRGFAG